MTACVPFKIEAVHIGSPAQMFNSHRKLLSTILLRMDAASASGLHVELPEICLTTFSRPESWTQTSLNCSIEIYQSLKKKQNIYTQSSYVIIIESLIKNPWGRPKQLR